MCDKGVLSTGQDYHCAALILQHGETTVDYKKAHEFAAKAVNLGDESAKWLYAATIDRWLLSQEKLQLYGTQFKILENGDVELYPVDPKVTDEERAEWDVPPLAKALEIHKKYTEV